MYDIIREIFFYLVFLVILLVVSYGFRDPYAFLLRSSVHREFVDADAIDFDTVSL